MSKKEATKKYIEERIKHAEGSLIFFSNNNKIEREKWVCKELLSNLGIKISNNELCPSNTEPPDIIYKDCYFEVKELLDNTRRRHDEIKKKLSEFKKAKRVDDFLEPYTPKDIPLENLFELLKLKIENNFNKYGKKTCENLDLLYYVNLKDYSVTGETISTDNTFFLKHGWRSVSMVSNNCSLVFYVSDYGSKVLKPFAGKVKYKDYSQNI